MSGNILEERMAGNSQEARRALLAAESVLAAAIDTLDDAAFSLEHTSTSPFRKRLSKPEARIYGKYLKKADYSVYFRQRTPPARGSGWDSTYAFYHFDVESHTETAGKASATIHSGVYDVGRR